jgi:hypothetical protein
LGKDPLVLKILLDILVLGILVLDILAERHGRYFLDSSQEESSSMLMVLLADTDAQKTFLVCGSKLFSLRHSQSGKIS